MRRSGLMVLSLLLWLLVSGMATAATSPAKVVQQFIDAHLQGRFAAARSLTLEQANMTASLFSSWLFGIGGNGGHAATADVFLSRKFVQAFRYNVIGATPSGDNQVYVTVMRVSPNLVHMYTWALAPKLGATPYELIEAIDTYLTKVNFPIEESRMHFTLIREVGDWYISAIRDEKFVQLQQRSLSLHPLGAAGPSAGVATSLPSVAATAPSVVATTSSDDFGRQMADAQFNATLQSFNYAYGVPAPNGSSQATPEPDKPSFLNKVGRLFGLGGTGETDIKLSDTRLKTGLKNIRDALARYAGGNEGLVPDSRQIYDWQSLRELVNQYGKKPLPATEVEAGFSFVRYRTDFGRGNYTLLLELHEPQDDVKRVEVTLDGIDRAS
jgi:hypothetical protein